MRRVFRRQGKPCPRRFPCGPDLYAAYLHGASQWDRGICPHCAKRRGSRHLYGSGDEYYGPRGLGKEAYEGLHAAYVEAGWSKEDRQRSPDTDTG